MGQVDCSRTYQTCQLTGSLVYTINRHGIQVQAMNLMSVIQWSCINIRIAELKYQLHRHFIPLKYINMHLVKPQKQIDMNQLTLSLTQLLNFAGKYVSLSICR